MVRLDFGVARRGFFFPGVIYYKQAAPTELNQPGKSST